MSVLLVTDDSDDDLQIHPYEELYQQIRELKYNHFSFVPSLSIIVTRKSSPRQRRSRPQQCLVKHLFTYMLTLLFLTNHLHWSLIFFSVSSLKIMSTYASPNLRPSTINDDDQQCLSIDPFHIDRICSRACRAQKTPFEKLDNTDQFVSQSHYFPFCSNHTFIQSINITNLDEISENDCREIFSQLLTFDKEARKASESFSRYMEAIDSASKENRYSIIIADCQQAYQNWACSVKIPYYHQNSRILPCQTICDEVERVCPTFRPSDREPLFAGQPLFFCNGGIVTNNNYGHRPHCFDTCHLTDGSFQRHSVSSSSSSKTSSVTNLVKDRVTTPSSCFEIEPLSSSPIEQFAIPLAINGSNLNYTSNTTISASAISILHASIIGYIVTFITVLLLKILQDE